jgi:hypothetical protein
MDWVQVFISKPKWSIQVIFTLQKCSNFSTLILYPPILSNSFTNYTNFSRVFRLFCIKQHIIWVFIMKVEFYQIFMSIEIIIWFLFFIMLTVYIILINLCMLYPGENPMRLWYMVFLMCWWIQFASILLRIFASIFIRNIGLWSWSWKHHFLISSYIPKQM